MKTSINLSITCFLLLLVTSLSWAQSPFPEWTRDINALPDSISKISPVKMLSDNNGNVIVLSNYLNSSNPNSPVNKIYVRKYDINGLELWTYIAENSLPNAKDMVIDNTGNVYIAGGLMSPFSIQPLLMKIGANGNFIWQVTTTSSFSIGNFSQLLLQNNFLYAGSLFGIAKFNLNGEEQWSNNFNANYIAIDHQDRVIFSGFDTTNHTLFRLDPNGTINFSDTAILAKKIVVDYDNSFYLMNDNYPFYTLVKYDSLGVQQWTTTDFPQSPAFGDMGLEMEVDGYNNIWVVGVQDTIVKLNSSGTVLWKKPMQDMDNYQISTVGFVGSSIFVAGSSQGFGSGNIKVSLFNTFGDVTYSNTYSGVVNGQEFAVDLLTNGEGIYVLENLDQNTRLIKGANPFSDTPINFDLVCVDSVWYNPTNPFLINIRIYNGSLGQMSYPAVRMLSPNGDTISNQIGDVSFFAHIYNTFQTYTDSIYVQGITDFTNFSYLFSTNFGDTSVFINWCLPTQIKSDSPENIQLFPNPVSSVLTITAKQNATIKIYNALGMEVYVSKKYSEGSIEIDVSHFDNGLYIIQVMEGNKVYSRKIIKY